MKVKILSSKEYESKSTNYGDCSIVYNSNIAYIYDCGSEEHARRVKAFLDEKGIEKIYVILSHNDEDHFKGIDYLINNMNVLGIYTTLLLKYLDDIYDAIEDKRKTKNSIRDQILREYDNIASLTGNNLKDYAEVIVTEGLDIVGPSKEYLINSVAKLLDSTESDNIDGETIFNAASIQVGITLDNGKKMILTGDSSFPAIEDKIKDYDVIQLPHHGKPDTAEKIFEKLYGENEMLYIVSDNTGNSNGGSDDLKSMGRKIKNTRIIGDIDVEDMSKEVRIGTYGDI